MLKGAAVKRELKKSGINCSVNDNHVDVGHIDLQKLGNIAPILSKTDHISSVWMKIKVDGRKELHQVVKHINETGKEIHLNLSGSKLEDDDLQVLQYLADQLSELYLSDNKITDLTHLHKMNRLSLININGNPLKDKAKEEICEKIPQLVVVC